MYTHWQQDPRYAAYLETTKEPTLLGYQIYCSELFEKERDIRLARHRERNERYLKSINHWETYTWLLLNIKDCSHYGLEGAKNSLLMELSKDNFNKFQVRWILEKISHKKQLLD